MTPFEALTEQDKKYITEYIEKWGGVKNVLSLKASLDYILREWDKNKQTLFDIFGEKLMLEKEIEIEDGANKKIREINDYVFDCKAPGYMFLDGLRKVFKSSEYLDNDFDIRIAVNGLTSGRQLYTNRLAKGFSYRNKDGKTIKVPEGAKVMKVLQKMAKEFDLPDFEIFRNRISRLTETRKSKVKFTLSIHPLDYMTMSDNANGWESCMNWTQGPGGYRAGTVEMMNSPLVVVAYITSKPYYPTYTLIEWTSKSWRELIIVHPYTICSVKSYPYYNISFDKALVNWLADMVEEKTEWRYNRSEPQENLDSSCYINAWKDDKEDLPFLLEFETDEMYNDFGNSDNYGLFSVEHPDNRNRMASINYSGPMTCMCCGESNYWTDDTEAVVCEDCDPPAYCACCGERIDAADAIEVDNDLVCEDCYESMTRCMCCESAHLDDVFTPVFVGHIESQTINTDYDEHFICTDCLSNNELPKQFGNFDIRTKMTELDGGPYYGMVALLIEEDDLDLGASKVICNDPYADMISSYNIRHYPSRFYNGNTPIAI